MPFQHEHFEQLHIYQAAHRVGSWVHLYVTASAQRNTDRSSTEAKNGTQRERERATKSAVNKHGWSFSLPLGYYLIFSNTVSHHSLLCIFSSTSSSPFLYSLPFICTSISLLPSLHIEWNDLILYAFFSLSCWVNTQKKIRKLIKQKHFQQMLKLQFVYLFSKFVGSCFSIRYSLAHSVISVSFATAKRDSEMCKGNKRPESPFNAVTFNLLTIS